MEMEQPKSRFQKIPGAELTPASLSADSLTGEINGGYNESSNEIAKFLQKITADIYRLADNFSGSPSYFLRDFSNDFYQQPLHEVFQELLDNDFVGKYAFSDERYNDAPSFYHLDIVPNYPPGITDGNIIKTPMGHGFGKNAEEVFSKAIGEFLERFFLTIYHKKDLIRGSLKDLKKKGIPALDLKTLAGFSDEQKRFYPRFRFDEESIFGWEKAKRISSGETFYLPAQLIHWNYAPDESEPIICEFNTNGAGGMFTKEGAILAGIYELVQRDSFLIHWLNRLTPDKIDPHTVPDEAFQNLLAESERYGFEVYCLNITADTGIPAFAVIISDPSANGESPRFCLGGGCQPDPIKALFRALEESWSVYYWMRPHPVYPALLSDYRPFCRGIGQDERLRLWSNPEMAKHFKFLIFGKDKSFSEINFDYPKNFSSQKEELDFSVKRIEALGPGYEVYYYESRHPFLSRVGYHSAQAVVPQFISLYLNEYYAPLGSKRLKEAPKKLGFKPAEKWNPWPHPFP